MKPELQAVIDDPKAIGHMVACVDGRGNISFAWDSDFGLAQLALLNALVADKIVELSKAAKV